MSMPESGRWEEGREAVQEVDLPGMGLNWPWGMKEEEGAVWGDLHLGVLGKGTWSLVVLVTKMEQVGVGW